MPNFVQVASEPSNVHMFNSFTLLQSTVSRSEKYCEYRFSINFMDIIMKAVATLQPWDKLLESLKYTLIDI